MIRNALIATAVATLALQAQAANVVFNFTGEGFNDGTFASKTLTGQFSYDTDAIVAGVIDNTSWAPVTSLSFTLNGTKYTVSGNELLGSSVNFEAGAMIGIDSVASFSANGKDFSMLLVRADSIGPYPAYALYADSAFADVGTANLSFTAAVPEPETYALMLGGLGLVGWMARRRKSA